MECQCKLEDTAYLEINNQLIETGKLTAIKINQLKFIGLQAQRPWIKTNLLYLRIAKQELLRQCRKFSLDCPGDQEKSCQGIKH